MAHAGGRPTKYNKEMLEKAKQWLKERKDKVERVDNKGTRNDFKIKVDLPTFAKLAVYLKVNKVTLQEWGKVNKEFSQVLDEIRNEQEVRLLDNGLSGDYNSNIAKLILSARHEYREKSEVDHTTKGEKIENKTIINLSDDELSHALSARLSGE